MGYLQTRNLEAVRECVRGRLRSQSRFASAEMLDSIEKSRAAKLAGSRDQYRTLTRRTRTLLRRDKERYVRSPGCEDHLIPNDLKPAYRAMKKLRSKSISRVSAIRTADGCLVSAVVQGEPSKRTASSHWVTNNGCSSIH